MAKRVLVTGGGGFLGSHLCKRLLDLDHTVICLDDFSTGSLANIAALTGANFTCITWDAEQPYDFEVDEIYNLACPASPPHYQRDPIKTTKTSVIGAINALELARRVGAKVLQASTSEIYGDPQVSPQHESYWGHVNPTGPRSCYDEGKRCAESLFFDYSRKQYVRVRVARIFNTYGPCMAVDDGRLVSNLIVQNLRGDAMTVYGDGRQTRSFCYRDDLVEGLIRLMNANDSCTSPVNLGNPEEFTVLEVAELIQEISGRRSEIVFMPPAQDDPRQRRPEISRAAQLLDWRPRTSLREGLSKTLAYFEKRLETVLLPGRVSEFVE